MLKKIKMLAILRTNNFSEDYKIVEIIKNPISSTNGLAEIGLDGETLWTGGILCSIHDSTLKVLNNMLPEEQWKWLCSIKCPNLYVQ
jgi:hypothetical protein